jgi:hypothetical protein
VPIQFNFSPTLALAGDYAVLASTSAIAHEAVQKIRDQSNTNVVDTNKADASNPDPQTHVNTLLRLDGPAVVEALTINRDQLISQNMLEKGHTQEEAAGEIDTLLRLAGLVQAFEVSFSVGRDAEIQAALRVKP